MMNVGRETVVMGARAGYDDTKRGGGTSTL